MFSDSDNERLPAKYRLSNERRSPYHDRRSHYAERSKSRSRSPGDRYSRSRKTSRGPSERDHRTHRFFDNRTISNNQERKFCVFEPQEVAPNYNGPRHECSQCKKIFASLKAVAHHILQSHGDDIPCFACSKKYPTIESLLDHIDFRHSQTAVQCHFCKATWPEAVDMQDRHWDHFKRHIYGELVYAKLAELQVEEEKNDDTFVF